VTGPDALALPLSVTVDGLARWIVPLGPDPAALREPQAVLLAARPVVTGWCW
jgi:hypothetical protein